MINQELKMCRYKLLCCFKIVSMKRLLLKAHFRSYQGFYAFRKPARFMLIFVVFRGLTRIIHSYNYAKHCTEKQKCTHVRKDMVGLPSLHGFWLRRWTQENLRFLELEYPQRAPIYPKFSTWLELGGGVEIRVAWSIGQLHQNV